MEKNFCIRDEKFDIISKELRRRGWATTESETDASLIWTNLVSRKHASLLFGSFLTFSVLVYSMQAKVRFDEVSENGSIVNHIRGSHNLSNKASLQGIHLHISR
jgi:hypothetical protein